MSLKYINNNGEEVVIAGKGLAGKNGLDGNDNVPTGIILQYEGEEIPEGFEEIENPNENISEITNTWTPSNSTLVAPSLSLLKGAVKVISTTFSFAAQTAGASGYVQSNITIPSGYTSCGAFVHTGQISGSYGMALTPVYGHALTTGSQTFYMNYYFPKASQALSATAYIVCIKTELITG